MKKIVEADYDWQMLNNHPIGVHEASLSFQPPQIHSHLYAGAANNIPALYPRWLQLGECGVLLSKAIAEDSDLQNIKLLRSKALRIVIVLTWQTLSCPKAFSCPGSFGAETISPNATDIATMHNLCGGPFIRKV